MDIKEVFNLWVARALINRGFKIVKTGTNPKIPEFTTWFFENTENFKIAFTEICLNKKHQKEK